MATSQRQFSPALKHLCIPALSFSLLCVSISGQFHILPGAAFFQDAAESLFPPAPFLSLLAGASLLGFPQLTTSLSFSSLNWKS